MGFQNFWGIFGEFSTKKDKKITGFENIEILDMGGSIRYTLRYTEKSDISAFDNFSIRYAHPSSHQSSLINGGESVREGVPKKAAILLYFVQITSKNYQKCTYQKLPQNLGRASPPHLDKIQKNSSFFQDPFPELVTSIANDRTRVQ